MNRLIKSYVLILAVICASFYSDAVENQLQKVFCHKGAEQLSLELGKIAFYFSEKPIIKQVSNENNKKNSRPHYCFPSPKQKLLLQNVNK